jgi:hypothetical protein
MTQRSEKWKIVRVDPEVYEAILRQKHLMEISSGKNKSVNRAVRVLLHLPEEREDNIG